MVTSAVNRPSTQASGRTIPYGAPPLMFALWSQSGASGRTNDPAPGVCALQSRQAVNVSSKYSRIDSPGYLDPSASITNGSADADSGHRGCVPTSQTSPTMRTHDSRVMGTWPKRSVSQSASCAEPGPGWVIGRHRGLVVVVGVKPIPLLGEPLDDELDVAPGTARHLVADQLRVLGQPSLMYGAAKLSLLQPHLVVITSLVAAEPVRQRSHAPSSCPIDNHQAPCSFARAANSSTGDEMFRSCRRQGPALRAQGPALIHARAPIRLPRAPPTWHRLTGSLLRRAT